MNPNISEDNKNTCFGQPGGADPSEASRKGHPWSIRHQLRYLAAQRVDLTMSDALTQLFGPEPTVAQRIAFKTMLKALAESDLRAIEFIDERLAGKLPQMNLNCVLNAIEGMDDDELTAFIQSGLVEISSIGESAVLPVDDAIN